MLFAADDESPPAVFMVFHGQEKEEQGDRSKVKAKVGIEGGVELDRADYR